ncbi:MAG: hypothetical protein H6736_00295 [Alphaproteobacteria bacterium]|nr:hypothetical protein [Alphaproteobacteria bacterium]
MRDRHHDVDPWARTSATAEATSATRAGKLVAKSKPLLSSAHLPAAAVGSSAGGTHTEPGQSASAVQLAASFTASENITGGS